MNELYHHGVKGMRWGVRRYQNKDGSLTPAGQKRLDSYKQKELEKVAEKYQVDKLSIRRDSMEERFLKKNDTSSYAKLSRARYRHLKAQGMEFLESSKIASMSYQDMVNEKSDIRKAKVNKFVGGLGKKLVGKVIRESSGDMTIGIDNYKTNRRVSLEDSIYNEYEARKATGYRGL